MTDLALRADSYLTAWSLDDETERALILRDVVTDDLLFADPLARFTGRDELLTLMAKVRIDHPGTRFERSSPVDAHAGGARYAWTMYAEDGTIALTGIDVVEAAPDGRFSRITGFFDPPADARRRS